MMMADVLLHGVPLQKVDVSENTAPPVLVSAEGHTKKCRPALPIPHGFRINESYYNYCSTQGQGTHLS